MYDFSLVKKKKRNKRVAIASGIGAVGVTALIIVSFLGHSVGSFTVNLKNEGVSLTMDTSSSFEKSTSYLNPTGFGSLVGQCTYSNFLTSSLSFDMIDNEETTFEIGNDSKGGLKFFKFTFFLKNNGSNPAGYDMDIKILNNKAPTNNAASLDQYLRFMVFEEGREPVVYARRSNTVFDDNGNYAKEYISGKPEQSNYFGEAEPFIDDINLISINNKLVPSETRRYTYLLWLEGEDPEGNVIPKNASLRIGATINAYPN